MCFTKMNEIVHRLFLTGDKCITKLHLEEPGFTYGACGVFTNPKKKELKCVKKKVIYINRKELDKALSSRDSVYFYSKDSNEKTITDKELIDKAYDTASRANYHEKSN